MISRQKFPKGKCILSISSKPHSFHSVHSAIGSRMNGMIFRLAPKRTQIPSIPSIPIPEWSQKNAPLIKRPIITLNALREFREVENCHLGNTVTANQNTVFNK